MKVLCVAVGSNANIKKGKVYTVKDKNKRGFILVETEIEHRYPKKFFIIATKLTKILHGVSK